MFGKQTFKSSDSLHYSLTGKRRTVINLGSYNYLGFSDCKGPCADDAEKTTEKYGVGTCASRQELGKNNVYCCISFM